MGPAEALYRTLESRQRGVRIRDVVATPDLLQDLETKPSHRLHEHQTLHQAEVRR